MSEKEVADDHKKTKHRSPNYPAIDLRTAIGHVEKLYKEDGPAGAPVGEAVKHFGFGSAHGGAMVVVSALKKYGLVEDQNGRLAPSSVAMSILEFPEDDPRRGKAIKTAALNPPIIKELVDEFKSHGRLPSPSSLRGELITRKKFNPKAVDDFQVDFRQTLAYAGLTDADGVFSNEAMADLAAAEEEQAADKPSEWARKLGALFPVEMARQPQMQPTASSTMSPAPKADPTNRQGTNMRELVIPLMDGETARLEVPVRLSEENYEYMMEQLAVFKRGIVSKSQVVPPTSDQVRDLPSDSD